MSDEESSQSLQDLHHPKVTIYGNGEIVDTTSSILNLFSYKQMFEQMYQNELYWSDRRLKTYKKDVGKILNEFRSLVCQLWIAKGEAMTSVPGAVYQQFETLTWCPPESVHVEDVTYYVISRDFIQDFIPAFQTSLN